VLTATPGALTDKNLYAYCDNDPIMRADQGGYFWHIVAGAAIGGLIGGTTKLICNIIEKKENVWAGVGVATFTSAASGALAATGIGLVGQVAGGSVIAMGGNALQQGVDIATGEKDAFSVGEMLVDGAIGAICGFAGGSGASQGNSKSAMTLGKQLSRRIINTGEWKKSFAYYGKSMMNGVGKSIYKELGRSFIKSGLTGLSISVARSIKGTYYD